MGGRQGLMVWGGMFMLALLLPDMAHAMPFVINARSAISVDVSSGEVIFEQNADAPIAPASVTKILSLYLVFDAIGSGRVHPWDKVRVSSLAALTGGSRMGLRARDEVPLEELVKGMAIVSGNDASVAVAEYLEGSVESFVRKMNAKARELGMRNSLFLTPNGLPAKGQLTTARDIAKLSVAYLRRFPESLAIHSLCSYKYRNTSHHNANRLLGTCPGVDGLKTGFVCASGYNISATAKRGNTRIVAVVMGARSPGVRSTETAKLLNGTYHELAMAHPEKAHEFEAVYSGSCTVQQESNLKARAQDGHRTRKGLRIGKPKIRLSHGKSKIAGNTKSLGEEKPAKAIDRMASKRPSGESKATKSNHAAETSKHTHVRASSEAKTKPVAGVGGRVAKTRAERAGASEKGAAVRKASHEHGSREAKSASKDQEVEKGKSQQKKKKHSVSST